MLETYRLPAFHMTDCANGAEDFKSLKMQDRINVATEAIGLIRKHMIAGRMVSIYPADFETYAPDHDLLGSAYSMCVHGCLAGIQHWANHNAFSGGIAYFFEAGHKSQGQANRIMNEIFKDDRMRKAHRYASHTFADKKKVQLLQAADIIAWHWFTENKRKLEAKRPTMRADTVALMGVNRTGAEFVAVHYDPQNIKLVTRSAYADKYPMTYPGVL